MAHSLKKLREENEELRQRLAEATEALEAIRTGKVESLVVEGPQGLQIFSLEGATHSYRVLVEAMNEGAATLNEHGTVLYCNSRFARMLGARLEFVMGHPIHPWIAERDRGAFGALLRRDGGDEARSELTLLTDRATELPAHLSVNRISEDGRQVVCLVATDISKHRQAEEALRASEERFRIMADSAPILIWASDEEGRNRFVNRAYCEFFGVTREDVEGGKWEPQLHSDDAAAYVAALRRAVRERAPFTAEARVRRADGTWRSVASHAEPKRSPDGTFLGHVGVSPDITDYRRMETALRDADRRKDTFLAGLSHELRNPLAPIRSSLYILRQVAPGGEQARRALLVIERQVDHLVRLVDDLLDLTRVAENKIRLRRERVELNELVRRTVEDHVPLFERNEIALERVPSAAPVFVYADPARLVQVVTNLLQNAAKFTGRGGRTRIVVGPEPAVGETQITVSDTGIGMAPEMLGRLFEPFAQAAETLDRSAGGLGLGLALVKGLVALHGGSVSATSAGPAQGSEFRVRLPVAGDAVVAPADSSPAPAAAAAVPTARHILVIEDQEDASETLRESLELMGYEVRVARTGDAGVAAARARKPDVVVCDIGLPGLDGYAVARALRADKTLKSVHLLALSGYSLPEDRRRSLDAGFDAHMAKPVDMRALEQIITTLSRVQSGPGSPALAIRT